MDLPTTSIDAATGGLKITWTAPYDGASAILSYLIEIKDQAGTAQVTSSCDGSDTTTRDQAFCIVPMSELTAPAGTFQLVLNDLVEARATATNAVGTALLASAYNTIGETVDTIPTLMTDPVRDSASTATSFVITWPALSLADSMGGSTITSYSLEWDAQSAGASFTPLVGFSSDSLDLTYTVSTGVSAGNDYQFRLRAENIYGFGPYSNTITFTASGRPA